MQESRIHWKTARSVSCSARDQTTHVAADGETSMIAAERRATILELIRAQHVVSLQELVSATGTSAATVRRDLHALEESGLLDRRHGGAVLPGALDAEQSYRQKTKIATDEKHAIAAAALEFIDDGDAILLGAGSTTHELARRLRGRHDLTVLTNSLLVAQALANTDAEVVMTGGTLRGSTFSLVGEGAERSLVGIRVRTAFISGNGLTATRGLSTPNMLVASIDRALVATAGDVVVLADHTKVGIDTMYQTVPPDSICRLITDAHADGAVVRELRAAGVQVDIAEPTD